MIQVQRGVSLLVPVYNERSVLRSTLQESLSVLHSSGHPYEVIVIDDGSTDGSRNLIESIDGCRVVRHQERQGYGQALKSGLRASRFSLIAIVDADGTYPLRELPRLLEDAEQFDMTVAQRQHRPLTHSLLRRIVKTCFACVASIICGRFIPDLNSGMRVFRRDLAMRYLTLFPSGFSFTTTITMAALLSGCRVRWLPVHYVVRVGQSKFRPIRDTLLILRAILKTTLCVSPGRILTPCVFMVLAAAILVFFTTHRDEVLNLVQNASHAITAVLTAG